MSENSLQRFLDAQQWVYADVVQELRQGKKRSHWMWFIFPQIDGLGKSKTARLFAIKSSEEASAYLAHPLLGERLRECTQLVMQHTNLSSEAIFGYPDYLKFQSCLTLFDAVQDEEKLFNQALQQFYAGHQDRRTLEALGHI